MKRFSPPFIPHNFGGLPKELTNLKKSKVVVLPIPYDQTVSYRPGTRDGAAAIITASKYVELYDSELNTDISKIGIHTILKYPKTKSQ